MVRKIFYYSRLKIRAFYDPGIGADIHILLQLIAIPINWTPVQPGIRSNDNLRLIAQLVKNPQLQFNVKRKPEDFWKEFLFFKEINNLSLTDAMNLLDQCVIHHPKKDLWLGLNFHRSAKSGEPLSMKDIQQKFEDIFLDEYWRFQKFLDIFMVSPKPGETAKDFVQRFLAALLSIEVKIAEADPQSSLFKTLLYCRCPDSVKRKVSRLEEYSTIQDLATMTYKAFRE